MQIVLYCRVNLHFTAYTITTTDLFKELRPASLCLIIDFYAAALHQCSSEPRPALSWNQGTSNISQQIAALNTLADGHCFLHSLHSSLTNFVNIDISQNELIQRIRSELLLYKTFYSDFLTLSLSVFYSQLGDYQIQKKTSDISDIIWLLQRYRRGVSSLSLPCLRHQLHLVHRVFLHRRLLLLRLQLRRPQQLSSLLHTRPSATVPTSSVALLWLLNVDDMTSYCTVNNLNIQRLFVSVKASGSHAKLDMLRQLCNTSSKLDIICISETKLGDCIDSSKMDIPEYSLHRRDPNRRGGGVIMYYQSKLNASQ